MTALDFKKEYKDLYQPGQKPSLIDVPEIPFVAVRGKGNPNAADGDYAAALAVLYALSYTIRMSGRGGHAIDGFFEYVVPPLEGLWWMADGTPGVNYGDKESFQWISMIRLPDFATDEVFCWAQQEAAQKKGLDTSLADRLVLREGLCVQCLHVGPYDDEPATIARLDRFAEEAGCRLDFSAFRRHHEIYLSDPRRTAPDKLRTVIRHPVALV